MRQARSDGRAGDLASVAVVRCPCAKKDSNGLYERGGPGLPSWAVSVWLRTVLIAAVATLTFTGVASASSPWYWSPFTASMAVAQAPAADNVDCNGYGPSIRAPKPPHARLYRHFNCTVGNSEGWYSVKVHVTGDYPAYATSNISHIHYGRIPTALCVDGTYSYAAHHQGACSWHGGVSAFYK